MNPVTNNKNTLATQGVLKNAVVSQKFPTDCKQS